MRHIQDLTEDELKEEYCRADMATGMTKGRERARWGQYRHAVLAELGRRDPVKMSADELVAALQEP